MWRLAITPAKTGMLCVCLLVLAAAALPVAADEPHRDPQGRYAFVVPDDFDLQEPDAVGNETAAILVASSYPDAGISVRTIAGGPSNMLPIAETQAAMRDIATRGERVSPDAVQGTIFGQRPATQIEFTYQSGTVRMRAMQYAVRQGQTLYIVTLAARATDFPAFYEDAKVMLDSFTFAA